jgi:hypothetical protein
MFNESRYRGDLKYITLSHQKDVSEDGRQKMTITTRLCLDLSGYTTLFIKLQVSTSVLQVHRYKDITLLNQNLYSYAG